MIREPAIITAVNLTPTPQLQSLPASDLSYSNQLISKPIFNPITEDVNSRLCQQDNFFSNSHVPEAEEGSFAEDDW